MSILSIDPSSNVICEKEDENGAISKVQFMIRHS